MALGRFFGSLFNGASDEATPTVVDSPVAADEPEYLAATRRLNQLKDRVRAAGRDLPGLLTSRLGQIDDRLRDVIAMIASQGASTEQQVLLDAIIDDYLPTPLRTYLTLPERERDGEAPATLQLSAQLGLLEETISDLHNQIRIGAIAELSTHGRFLESKFNAETLRLDGRA